MEKTIEIHYSNSSHIEKLTYVTSDKTLLVKFKSQDTFEYSQVPREAFEVLSNAESVGQAFHKIIKQGGYAFRRVTS